MQMLQELRERIGILTFPKKGGQQADDKVAARSDCSDTESLPEHRPTITKIEVRDRLLYTVAKTG